MRLSAFLTELGRLHMKAKVGQLLGDERQQYDEQREELAQALLNAQKLTLKPGELARRALRVAHVLPVELTAGGERLRALTVELSVDGFSSLLGNPLRIGDAAEFQLALPGGQKLAGKAFVKNVLYQGSNYRIGFQLDGISEADRERMQLLIFDAVLDKLRVR